MREFALEILLHSLFSRIDERSSIIIRERMTIIQLDHATELLMKSFLLKNSYIINEFKRKKIEEGFKANNKISDLLDEKKTISFPQALKITSKLVNLNNQDKKVINDFHDLRNNIQHRALNIPLNKAEKIDNFKPILYNFYKLMFPTYKDLEKIEGMLIEPQF